MPLLIAGLGTAVPPHRIAQADAARIAATVADYTPEQQRLLEVLYRRSGVETRHSVLLKDSEGPLAGRQSFYPRADADAGGVPPTSARMRQYEADAGPLAVTAARRALADAALLPEAVTHLVTVSCSGFAAPGFDFALMRALPLRPQTARTHVGFMGCHAALNALRVARAFVEADPAACVLVCALELCSLHHHSGWEPEKIVANSLFADGASALVGVSETRPDGTRRAGISPSAGPDPRPAWHVTADGSCLMDDSAEAMTWRIGDHGFEMTLSPGVPDLIGRHLRPWLDGWLAGHGLTVETVGSWAVHPGGPRILAAVLEAAGLERPAVRDSQEVLARYGNMSSATVLFILERLRRGHAPLPCVALGFGPGVAVEAALLC